jgi:sugar phosphate isomerase/epimerase
VTHPIPRRAACQALAAGAAAAAAAFARAAENATEKLPGELLLASAMYGNLPLAEVLRAAPLTDAKQIDLWRKPHADHWEQAAELGDEKFAALLKQHQVALGAITVWNGDFDGSFQFAERHGAKLIVTGFVPLAAKLDAFLQSIEPQAARAEKLGITLAIENHGASFDEIRRFVDACEKRPPLGVALAPYHLPQQADELARLIADLGPQLKLFYAWQHGHGCMKKLPKDEELLQLPGRGELDFAPLLAALRTIDYAGPLEIFMHPVPRGIPILPTADEVTAEINRARDYLKTIRSS